MSKKDTLWELIHSLSASEKRHFKVFATKADKNYIQLFNAYNSAKKDNALSIENNLPPTYNKKNIAVEKNYLYNLLLNSISDYHKNSSVEYTIDSINKNIELLIQKGLLQQALTQINKAKKKATEAHVESPLIRTFELEQEVYNRYQDYKNLLASIDQCRMLIQIIANQYEYKELAFQMNYKEIQFRSTNKTEDLKELQNIMQNNLMLNEELALSYKSKMFLYQTKAMFYGIVNDEPLSIFYFEKMMRLMESAPLLIKQNPIDYILVFANVAMGKINLKQYNELLKTIEYIQQTPELFNIKNNIDFEANLFYFTQPYLLDIYTAIGDSENCKTTIQLIETKTEQYANYVIKTALLNTAKSMAIANFQLGDYKKSLKYMNQIFDDDLGKYSRGHIFNMIIHYELGNEQLLLSLISSTKRLLIQQNRLNKAETLMIDFFTKVVKQKEENKIKSIFIDYFKNAKQLLDDEDAFISLRYFDVIKWMESKIKSFELKTNTNN